MEEGKLSIAGEVSTTIPGNSIASAATTPGTALVEFKTPSSTVPKKKRIVLEEDKYAVHLEKIIERDYFPDLEKLTAQNAYLNALATNDIHMLRELYSKYSFGKRTPRSTKSSGSTLQTPSTFETPLDIQLKDTPVPSVTSSPTHLPMEEPGAADDTVSTVGSKKKTKSNHPSDMSLNDYLNTYTSEDNQSFQEFMEEAERKHKVKYAWLYDTEEESSQKQLVSTVVPSIEEQASEYKRPLDVETWAYRTKNFVMYVPDGVALSPAEEVALAKKQAGVVFANTRFIKTPFKETPPSSSSSDTPAPLVKIFKPSEGKIGVDGKEIESSTPKVNGFSYVRTPSPTPGTGVDESPFMTWGEIEGTPFRLDAGDTPLLAASTKPYKIFEQSKREKLGMELAEKVSHRYRDKKLKAMQAARSHLATPSPGGLKRGIEKLNSMTPAAQKFAKSHFGSRIGSSDAALRDSYTPNRSGTGTPGSSRSSLQTPTPSATARSSVSHTPGKSTRLPRRPSTVTTDDLLQIPRRKSSTTSEGSRTKAADFF